MPYKTAGCKAAMAGQPGSVLAGCNTCQPVLMPTAAAFTVYACQRKLQNRLRCGCMGTLRHEGKAAAARKTAAQQVKGG